MADSGANRRTHPRLAVMIPVEYKDVSDFFVDYAVDISHGGMFIVTDREIEMGAEVEIKFKVPEFDSVFVAKGSVVRRGKAPPESSNKAPLNGVGIKFAPLPSESRQIIERLWESKIHG
jgi:uncharacterized protein (TIGR02266 family)